MSRIKFDHNRKFFSKTGPWTLNRKVDGSNPDHSRPMLCPWERHFTRISSLHPSYPAIDSERSYQYVSVLALYKWLLAPELQIIFYPKEYLPPEFEINGYFAFQKKLRGYLVNSLIIFFFNFNTIETPKNVIATILLLKLCFFFCTEKFFTLVCLTIRVVVQSA
jgi:hypothetical protein